MNRNLVGATLVILCLSWEVDSAWAAIGASGSGGPSTMTDRTFSGGGFTFTEDIAFDPTAGPWIKHLMVLPGSGGIDSGIAVPIVEELTNVGDQAWTDWHEVITGPIEEFGFGPATAFAFERESVQVLRQWRGAERRVGLHARVHGASRAAADDGYESCGSGPPLAIGVALLYPRESDSAVGRVDDPKEHFRDVPQRRFLEPVCGGRSCRVSDRPGAGRAFVVGAGAIRRRISPTWMILREIVLPVS